MVFGHYFGENLYGRECVSGLEIQGSDFQQMRYGRKKDPWVACAWFGSLASIRVSKRRVGLWFLDITLGKTYMVGNRKIVRKGLLLDFEEKDVFDVKPKCQGVINLEKYREKVEAGLIKRPLR